MGWDRAIDILRALQAAWWPLAFLAAVWRVALAVESHRPMRREDDTAE